MSEAELPSWDLSELYQGIGDPKIGIDLESLVRRAEAFEQRYTGRVNRADISAAELRDILAEYEAICSEVDKFQSYAYMVHSAEANEATGAFREMLEAKAGEAEGKTVFLKAELAQLPDDVFKSMLESQVLANYRHYLEKFSRERPHILSAVEEKMMKDFELTGPQAFQRFFEQEHAVKRYAAVEAESAKELPQFGILAFLRHPERNLRRIAADNFTKGLREELRRNAFVFNVLVKDHEIRSRYRRYDDAEEFRHILNDIDRSTVDTMVSVVTGNYGVVQDFYRFKREALGYEKLYEYDRYAPMSQSSAKIPFGEAREVILEAFRRFSPRFAELTQEAFEKRRIDAVKREGKTGGMYNMPMTPDTPSYVLVNYDGNLDEVMALAHELGHYCHSTLSKTQSWLNMRYPITLAETASTFGEMLLFDSLKESLADPKDRFALYMGKIEGIFATVFRQTSMFNFERLFHATRRASGRELTADEIGGLWRRTQVEMFGDSLELTPNYDIWWSYIPHFLMSPFYVYGYSFGELLALALYTNYKSGQDPAFVEKYLELLKAGGSKSPDELLAPFGINLRDRAFWQGGIEIVRKMIEEAKSLA